MTHEELLDKAIARLRKVEPLLPEKLAHTTVDQLPKRRFRDAVVIDFSSDEDHGTIQVVMERESGEMIHTNKRIKLKVRSEPKLFYRRSSCGFHGVTPISES